MVTTSTVPAPLTPTGAPRVFTRGRLSPASTAIPMVLMPTMATYVERYQNDGYGYGYHKREAEPSYAPAL